MSTTTITLLYLGNWVLAVAVIFYLLHVSISERCGSWHALRRAIRRRLRGWF